LEDALEGREIGLEEPPVPGMEVQRVPTEPRTGASKKRKTPKASRGPVKVPVAGSPQGEPTEDARPAKINEDTKIPDPDTMYEAQCILKQRLRKGGNHQFLVKWANQSSTDCWCNEDDVSDALLAHWFVTHNQKGLKMKKLNVALINTSDSWACRRLWKTETPARVERVDEFVNEIYGHE